MATNATAVWRVRPSGNDNNGGGFDCALSSAATGTHGSFTGTTFTDATAAAFTSGMAGSAINILGIGQYLISAFIDASNITLSSGNPAVTLAGPLTWTVGSGQDYSQQNGAQVTQSGGTVSTATTTLTDTGATFTSALIGNGIRVAGTGLTTTYTFITAVPTGTTLTLQTSPGTTGTSVTYSIGGGWAGFTNTTVASAVIVVGNFVYILGSGIPNPAAYTYDYVVANTSILLGTTSAYIFFANDPATPSYKAAPDTTGGMPCIQITGSSGFTISNLKFVGIWAVPSAAAKVFATNTGGGGAGLIGCVFDALTFGQCTAGTNLGFAVGCEVFNSGSASGALNGAFNTVSLVMGCNIHDFWGIGVISCSRTINCIIAKCQSDGAQQGINNDLINCTVDGNAGHGVSFSAATNLSGSRVINNIISNHTVAAKAGIFINAGTAASNTGISQYTIDYNVFYNNTGNYTAIAGGAHDTLLSQTPYVASSTENYTLV